MAVALTGSSISDDGRLLAYSTSSAGSDWQTWKVRDLTTGQDLPDTIEWVKFSNAVWTADGKGFFYARYDAPKEGDALKGVNKFQKLYFHKVGTPQSDDVLIYERRDQPDVRWKGGDFPYHPSLHGGSIITQFTGLTVGSSPLNIFQDNTSVRDDYTTAFNMGGRHDIKMGGEYIRFTNRFIWCLRCDGVIDASAGAAPSAAVLQQMFPNVYDASTWNTARSRSPASNARACRTASATK